MIPVPERTAEEKASSAGLISLLVYWLSPHSAALEVPREFAELVWEEFKGLGTYGGVDVLTGAELDNPEFGHLYTCECLERRLVKRL